MIGLDTNVLVRYLVEDDPRQSAEAAKVMEGAVESGQQLFISQIVLCELVWVLAYAYALSRREVVVVLQQLRRAAQVVIESPDEVQRAIDSFERSRGDFPDFLIAERAVAYGCEVVLTFDRALHTDPRFRKP
ncbi:MAG TPA: type II toxin-antitoxin system VapC family toxin [Thermoanaerobaculia bacterium]|nr:type II toxin-antitoxin system VapC family toxin [Thermoanaerobaculia bacterium]